MHPRASTVAAALAAVLLGCTLLLGTASAGPAPMPADAGTGSSASGMPGMPGMEEGEDCGDAGCAAAAACVLVLLLAVAVLGARPVQRGVHLRRPASYDALPGAVPPDVHPPWASPDRTLLSVDRQ